MVLRLEGRYHGILYDGLVVRCGFGDNEIVRRRQAGRLRTFYSDRLLFQRLAYVLLPVVVRVPFVRIEILFQLLRSKGVDCDYVLHNLVALQVLSECTRTKRLRRQGLSFLFNGQEGSYTQREDK